MNIEKKRYKCALLIEDNDLDNFINVKMLENNGFSEKIYVTVNGQKALDFLDTLMTSGDTSLCDYPDIMFIDLNMPVMDGFEFLVKFKKIENEKLRKCKLAILTSSINKEDREYALSLDPNIVFLNKPLSNRLLDSLRD